MVVLLVPDRWAPVRRMYLQRVYIFLHPKIFAVSAMTILVRPLLSSSSLYRRCLLFASTTTCILRSSQGFVVLLPPAPEVVRILQKQEHHQHQYSPTPTTRRSFRPHYRPHYHSSRSMTSTTTTSSNNNNDSDLSFIDIGANLLDDRFTLGVYRGTLRHEPDLDLIVERAASQGVRRIILTAGTVEESRHAVQVARQWNIDFPAIQFYSTVGVHPTRCRQVFENNKEKKSPDELLQELVEIAQDGISDGTVVAVGEIGLDYDRLEFCSKEIQHRYLIRQLQTLAKTTSLPLFLHNRSVGADLYDVLVEHRDCWQHGGVVHSFDDSLDLANKFIDDLGLYIGLNGCSLRGVDNLAVAKALPMDRILLETDCPYCEVRATHAGSKYVKTKFVAKAEKKFQRGLMVKSRQEPAHIVQIAEIIAGCKGVEVKEVADACYASTLQLYGWDKDN